MKIHYLGGRAFPLVKGDYAEPSSSEHVVKK